MACLLQPECNFLHGFFRCKLPVEVVEMEVKVTLMQGTHIFKRDRTTQLTKCIPWTMKIHPHPTVIRKMKTFLEVENKMGLTIPIPAPNSQFRPPLLEMNPNVHKNDITDKRKRATPKRKFKPITPRVAVMCPPLPQAPPKPSNNMSSTPVWEDTPWSSTGKTSGNLFEDKKWLLPKGYLAIEGKKEDTTTPSLKEEPKAEDHSSSAKEEKCGWSPNCPFCKTQNNKGEYQQQRPIPEPQATGEAEMERLNSKYNLDCFLDSDLDSESDEGEQYQYEQGYKALI